MKLRDQVRSAIRRHFEGWWGFCGYLFALFMSALSWTFGGDWITAVCVLAVHAIVVTILIFKEGAFQKELRRRRALPAAAIRGASN